MLPGANIRQQFKSNAVAIVSIAIALTGLFYNTWRNETTETNRNLRVAAFEALKQLNELELTVNSAHYGMDKTQGSPILGWSRVVMLRDLSELLPPPAAADAANLYSTWEQNWEALGHDQNRVDLIIGAIAQYRATLGRTLKRLQ